MGALNTAYAGEVVERLRGLDAEAKPAWGSMTSPQVLGHLNQVVRYTLGEGPGMPHRGGWKGRYLFRPLILSQVVPLPRNVRLPNPDGSRTSRPVPEATVQDLEASLKEYLDGWGRGILPSRTHPFFGVLSPRAWRRFHYAHFEHHLKQFGR